MARGKPHSDELKAQVIASLLAGEGVVSVAERFGLDKAVVSRWKKEIDSERLQQVATKKEFDFGTKLATYLDETLTTLTEQAKHFRDKTWLSKQSASELAVLHGVEADKALRLLEAAERASVAAKDELPAISTGDVTTILDG